MEKTLHISFTSLKFTNLNGTWQFKHLLSLVHLDVNIMLTSMNYLHELKCVFFSNISQRCSTLEHL